MEHIFFEAQLCSEILIFKEKSNFGYTDHPEKPALRDKSANWDISCLFATIGININCPTSKLIVQPQCSVINHEIRDSGCRGSIRLVKSV